MGQPCNTITSGIGLTATTPDEGAMVVDSGTTTPVAIDPAAAADRITRVMIRFARIESSTAKAEVRGLTRGTRRPHDRSTAPERPSCRVIAALAGLLLCT